MNRRAAQLFYLVGPSGAGKDSLLAALETRGARGPRVARRYITRSRREGDEQHVEIETADFERREQAGEFLFSWRSHGHCYGVGREILDWLDAGEDVIVNGSREYLEHAMSVYPGLQPIWLTATEASLRQRLAARGRESSAQIEARLARGRLLEARFSGEFPRIDNNRSIERALEQLDAICSRD